jgi:hypothetical protein
MFQKDVTLEANKWYDLRELANARGANWTDATPFVAQCKTTNNLLTITADTKPEPNDRDGALVPYLEFSTFMGTGGKAWACSPGVNGRMFLQEVTEG